MAKIQFSTNVPAADLSDRPVTILGKRGNLKKVQYRDVSPYIQQKVSSEVSRVHARAATCKACLEICLPSF